MQQITTIIQIVTLVGMVTVLAVIIVIAQQWAEMRLLLVFPALWSVLGVVFYSLLLAGQLSSAAILLWGAVLRFLAMVMVLGAVVALWVLLRLLLVPSIYLEGDHDDGVA
jgi:hypothetical protein